jgi:cytochrome c-type biogenesis protein CcmH
MNQSKERTDPNQPMTGAVPMQQQQPAAAPDPMVQQLEAAVRSNPNDMTARADLAKAYLDRENIDGVIEQTQFILQKNPNDARALTYEALVRVGIGQADTALPMLQRATKSDPKFLDAWVGLAWVHATANRMKEADEAIATAKRLRPDEAERLDQLMAHIKQPQTASAPGQAPAPVAPSGNGVVVALNTAPNAQIPPNGIVFVIARAAGVTAGPPIAVKRVPVRQFPFEVEITTADSMTGQPLPPSMNIDARLDADGDAMTKTAADLRASQDGVAMGQKITLTLR